MVKHSRQDQKNEGFSPWAGLESKLDDGPSGRFLRKVARTRTKKGKQTCVTLSPFTWCRVKSYASRQNSV